MALSLIVVEAEVHHGTRTHDESGEQEEKEFRRIRVRVYRAPVEEEDTDYYCIHETG
jgi:hypothetical protein